MRRRLLTLFAAVPVLLGAQSRPRATVSVETGAAAIEQPLVRSGAAFYVAPGAELSTRGFTLGSNAVLAAGSPVWRSFLGTGFVRSPTVANLRLTVSGQALATSGIERTWHHDGALEWRRQSATTAATARVRAGLLNYRGAWWPDVDVGASAVHAHGATVLGLDATWTKAKRSPFIEPQLLGTTPTSLEDFTAQTVDLTPRVTWEHGRLRADGSLALRVAERGMRGTRTGPQLSLTWTTSRGVSLFVGGVQRLPDVRSGVPAGRSALLGLRLENSQLFGRAHSRADETPSLRVERGGLVIDAGPHEATRASIRGDFTAWKERECESRTGSLFYCGRAPAAGTWRVAVRLDDNAWQQPRNLPAVADDFGTVDGILLTGGKP